MSLNPISKVFSKPVISSKYTIVLKSLITGYQGQLLRNNNIQKKLNTKWFKKYICIQIQEAEQTKYDKFKANHCELQISEIPENESKEKQCIKSVQAKKKDIFL